MASQMSDNMESAKKSEKKKPLCSRCQNHGVISPVLGHKRYCVYSNCPCPKCVLTSEHQRVVAAQVKYKRQQDQDAKLGIDRTEPPDSTSPIPFTKLVESCVADPAMAAKALLLYYGTANTVATKMYDEVRFGGRGQDPTPVGVPLYYKYAIDYATTLLVDVKNMKYYSQIVFSPQCNICNL